MNKIRTLFKTKFNSILLIVLLIIANALIIKANILKSNFSINSNSVLQDSTNNKKVLKEISKLIFNVTNPETFTISYNGAIFEIAVVNNKYVDLKIINNGTGSLQGLDYHFTQTPKATVMMNAGMFEINGGPVGLLITNQKQIKKINLKKDLPGNFYTMKNAIFYVDTNGRYQVKNTISFNEYYKEKYHDILHATQSGPILTIDGKINKEFNVKSANKLLRNGIGVIKNSNNNIAILVVSRTPCSFYDLASIFKYLGCENSMYLDGTVSSLFYKKNKKDKPKFGDMKLGPVLIVIPKKP
jgi:uncharacterized protein YigE (DUF2233 family)